MKAVAVAMAEIVREGTWALRALGYRYGTAERAAGMLAWTEAVHGSGLTMLRQGEAAIIAGAARPQPRWSRDAQGRRCAEALRKCLFECGPPALDLATADARLGGGLGRVVLRGAIGTRLSGALGAMRRGAVWPPSWCTHRMQRRLHPYRRRDGFARCQHRTVRHSSPAASMIRFRNYCLPSCMLRPATSRKHKPPQTRDTSA